MVLTFSLIFSTLAIPAMAADHSIELRATSGNSYFGCLVKLRTMAQLGKVKGVKVNGTDYAKVTKKNRSNSEKQILDF